jgi:CDP-glycerol glycerophosphotransferase
MSTIFKFITLSSLKPVYYIFRFFKINENKIVFVNLNGSGYGCNPKYIAKKLISSEYRNKLEIVWLIKKGVNTNLHDSIRTVKIKSLTAFYEMATAKVWVSNNRLPYYVSKRKAQYYLHTWHGSLAFKQIEKGIPNMEYYYRTRSKHDSKMIDDLIVNCDYSKEYFRKVFWYDGSILNFGTPRNDIIINNNNSNAIKFKEKYSIDTNCNIVLYAPTFRKNNDLSVYNIDYNLLILNLEQKFGNKWKCFVRLHPVVAQKSNEIVYSENIINASNIADIQELLTITDVCITDYSSIIFDYMFSKRPAFFFACDYKSYKEIERGFWIDPKSLPFPFAENNNQLLSNIRDFNEVNYRSQLNQYIENLNCTEDGNSSTYYSKLILSKMDI